VRRSRSYLNAIQRLTNEKRGNRLKENVHEKRGKGKKTGLGKRKHTYYLGT
jgi:hypothetical protein